MRPFGRKAGICGPGCGICKLRARFSTRINRLFTLLILPPREIGAQGGGLPGLAESLLADGVRGKGGHGASPVAAG